MELPQKYMRDVYRGGTVESHVRDLPSSATESASPMQVSVRNR